MAYENCTAIIFNSTATWKFCHGLLSVYLVNMINSKNKYSKLHFILKNWHIFCHATGWQFLGKIQNVCKKTQNWHEKTATKTKFKNVCYIVPKLHHNIWHFISSQVQQYQLLFQYRAMDVKLSKFGLHIYVLQDYFRHTGIINNCMSMIYWTLPACFTT